ncbi:GILT-like protein 2 [Scaptodrosophila lebanonensis]|uniref:GILT-like protein 2 n=1 Tax=Drosophila lebanonensis TaxID=7225 RepID=A0A6J2T817_DROLE|nr:GILT-like protein 2 [Scaptodrosophila lebanonensis]
MKFFGGILLPVAILLGINVTWIYARRHRDPATDRLPITLYYEALCPYCMQFMTQQLYPSMKDRLPYTQLTLVPYGNARADKHGKITCQHGTNECELNAWHACILEHHDIETALKLISCMMRSRKNKLEICANRYQINIGDVKLCKKERTVDEILSKYGKETDKVPHQGVPAIAVDNHLDFDDQENLNDHFDSTFCSKYQAKFNKILKNCQ